MITFENIPTRGMHYTFKDIFKVFPFNPLCTSRTLYSSDFSFTSITNVWGINSRVYVWFNIQSETIILLFSYI